MYNNAIAGVSASGDRFFYVNRLASAGDGRDARWQRASLECCPPNLVRFLASMPGYIYAQDRHGAIYVNLYVSSDDVLHDRRQRTLRLSRRERDAVGRQIARSRVDDDAAMRAARSSCGFRAGRAIGRCRVRSIATRTRVDRQTTIVGQWRASRSAVPDDARLCPLDRDLEERRRDRASSSRSTSGRVVADPRVTRDARPHRDRARTDRLLRGVARAESGRRARSAVRSRRRADAVSVDGLARRRDASFRRTARRMGDASRRAAKPSRSIPYHLWANRGAGEMTVWLADARVRQSATSGPPAV